MSLFLSDIDSINLSFKGDSRPHGEHIVIVVAKTVYDGLSDSIRTREKELDNSDRA